MPVARFQLEDGRIARFEVPEGTTPEQAQSMMSGYDFKQNEAQPKTTENIAKPAVNTEPTRSLVSPAESLGRGTIQGVTMGYGDEGMGAIGALFARSMRPDLFKDQSLSDTYKQGRDIARNDEANARVDSPYWYGGGQLAGSVITGSKIPMPTSTAGKYLTGSAIGGVAGYGSSEANSASGQVLDTGLGIVAGIGGTYLGDKIGQGIAAVGNSNLVKGVKQSSNDLLSKFYASQVSQAPKAAVNPALVEAMKNGATPEEAAIIAKAKQFNIPLSRGDVVRSPEQQGLEDLALRGALTPEAADAARMFRAQQEQAMRDSAKGTIEKLSGVPYADNLADAGSAIKARLNKINKQDNSSVNALYKNVGNAQFLTPDMNAAKKILAEKSPPKPKSLTQFIVENGGMNDKGGDTRLIVDLPKFRPGLVNYKSGIDPDAMALKAYQAGYINDFIPFDETRPTVNHLLDALEGDFKGYKPDYSARDSYKVDNYNSWLKERDLADKVNNGYYQHPFSKLKDKVNEIISPSSSYTYDEALTPASKAAMTKVSNILDKPNPDLKEVDTLRKVLNELGQSSKNPTDNRNIKALKTALDESLDDAIEMELVSGDVNAIQGLRNATQASRQYFQKWKADDAIQKIVENDYTPEQVINLTRGYGQTGGNKQAAQLVNKLGGILGKDSPEFAMLKQAQLRQIFGKNLDSLLDGDIQKGFSAEEVRKNLTNLVNNNRSLANEYFSKEEVQVLKDFLDVSYRATNRVQGAVNYSNTTPALIRWSRQFANQFGTLGRLIGSPVQVVAGGMEGIKKGAEAQQAIDSFSPQFRNPNNSLAVALKDRLTSTGSASGANFSGQQITKKREPLKVTIRPESKNNQLQRFYQ
jgi:hypothetical protein